MFKNLNIKILFREKNTPIITFNFYKKILIFLMNNSKIKK